MPSMPMDLDSSAFLECYSRDTVGPLLPTTRTTLKDKGVTRLRKYFYRHFKRRGNGFLPSRTRQSLLNIVGKDLELMHAIGAHSPTPSCLKNRFVQWDSPGKCSLTRAVLLQDIVNCESPTNLVYQSEQADKPLKLRPCTSTPDPIPYIEWTASLTETPTIECFPRLLFDTKKELQTIRDELLPGGRYTESSLLLASPNTDTERNLELSDCFGKADVVLSCKATGIQALEQTHVADDVNNKENIPLDILSKDKTDLMSSSVKRIKTRRRSVKGQLLFLRRRSHGKRDSHQTQKWYPKRRHILKSPPCTVIKNDMFRLSHHKMSNSRAVSCYGFKKALVRSLIEKYIRSAKLKSGNAHCAEECLPFLSEGARRAVECFLCKSSIIPSQVVFCAHKDCRRSYHNACAKSSKDFIFRKNGDFVCPQHVCMTCRDHNKSKVLRCERCTVASHMKCLAFPEHVIFYTLKRDCMICWKHPKDWRVENKHKVSTADAKEVFKRLPIPYVPIEFSVGPGLPKEVFGNMLEPAPFVHIRRNIFLVKKKRDDADDGVGCLCKSSCGDDCLCRAQSMSCSKHCLCNDTCTNKPFRKDKKIKIVKTASCGWGVQASEPIARGEFIIEYVGEVINEAMCEDRLWTMKERGDHNFYMCEIGKDFIIDATFKGNPSRFVNHSCNPNCILEKWRVDGEVRVGIFAVRDIKDGEALTYDYRFVQYGQSVKCCCGAANCRGTLGESYQKKTKAASSNDFSISVRSDFPKWGTRHKRSHKERIYYPNSKSHLLLEANHQSSQTNLISAVVV